MRVILATAVALSAIGAAATVGAPAEAREGAYCFDKGTLTYRNCDAAPTPPPAPVYVAPQYNYPVFDWTNFYIGVHGGYADLDFSGGFDSDGGDDFLLFSELDPSGFTYGGQIGYDHQIGETYVVGIEIDGSFFDVDDDIASSGLDDQDVTAEITAFGSARLRGGLALDEFMPFITAGVGVVQYEATITDASAGQTLTADDLLIAPVIGGGLDILLFRDVSFRAEALYYIIDHEESLGDLADADDGDELVVEDLWTVRAALNFRF